MEKLTSAELDKDKSWVLLSLRQTSPADLLFAALICLLMLLALVGARSAEAQSLAASKVTEQQVKAAYLSKFGSYVEWPAQAFASPESPLRVGVISDDALADDLAQILVGRTIGGRKVQVQKLRPGDPVTGLNVLFIGRSGNKRLADILATTKGTPILTVTESAEGLALGSTINFVIIDGKVRFEVAPKTADLGNLNISARLLAAAHKVAPGPL
ncbi:MAG TPA: YfiR family protein [Noviherbaspirillum sp.]|nr:YfiR family protein [Noviherbaspirillum sp.]